jgi:carboxymethylenebutenolidase
MLLYLPILPYLNGKVGIIGYCSGGRQVYLAACTLKGIDAAIDCFGGGVAAAPAVLTLRPTRGSDLLHEGPELSFARAVREAGQESLA